MGMSTEENTVVFEGVVYEDELVGLRDFLQEKAPAQIQFDFRECNDIHLAVLQIVLAYKKMYGCDFVFGDERRFYQKVCDGFETTESHCG